MSKRIDYISGPRRAKWAEWREALLGRAKRKKKEEEKEAVEEKEVDLLEVFFYYIYR